MLWFCSFPSKKSCGLASWFRTFRRAPKTKKRERIRTGWGVQKCENLSKSFAKKFFPVAGTVLRIITQCLFPYFVFLKHFLTDYASLFEGHLVRVFKKNPPFFLPFFFLLFSLLFFFASREEHFSNVEKHFFDCFTVRKARFRLFQNAKSTFAATVSQCEMHFFDFFTMRKALFTMRKALFRKFHSTRSTSSIISLCEKWFRALIAVRKLF